MLATLRANGHAAYVVGGSLRDVMLGRRPVDWDMASNAVPERVVGALPGGRLREPVRDGRRAPRRRGVRDHDVPDRPRLRRFPAAASGRVQRHDRARPRAARLHGQRHGLGCATRRGARPRRSARGPVGRSPAAAPGGRRAVGPIRGGRAPDGPRDPPRDDARLRDRGRRRSPPSGTRRRSSRTCRGNGSPPSSTSCWPRRRRRPGSGC